MSTCLGELTTVADEVREAGEPVSKPRGVNFGKRAPGKLCYRIKQFGIPPLIPSLNSVVTEIKAWISRYGNGYGCVLAGPDSTEIRISSNESRLLRGASII